MVIGRWGRFSLIAKMKNNIEETINFLDNFLSVSETRYDFCVPNWTNPGVFYIAKMYKRFLEEVICGVVQEGTLNLEIRIGSNLVSSPDNKIYFIGSEYGSSGVRTLSRYDLDTGVATEHLSGDIKTIIEDTLEENISGVEIKSIAVSFSQSKIFVFYDQPNLSIKTRGLAFEINGYFLGGFEVQTFQNNWIPFVASQDGKDYIYAATANNKIAKISAIDYSTLVVALSEYTIDSIATDYDGKVSILTKAHDNFTIRLYSEIKSGQMVFKTSKNWIANEETFPGDIWSDFEMWPGSGERAIGNLFIKWKVV